MSAPIFRHDKLSGVDSGQSLEARSILTTRHDAAAGGHSSTTGVQTPTASRSTVVLELPELSLDAEVESDYSFELGNVLSWVAIGLGAVVAVGLIFSGRKSPPRPLDAPPAWEEHRDAHVEHAAADEPPLPHPTAMAPPAPAAPAAQSSPPPAPSHEPPVAQSAPRDSFPAPPEQQITNHNAAPDKPIVDRYGNPIPDPPGTSDTAAADRYGNPNASPQPGNPTPEASTVHTARGGSAAWDGGASRPQPGEAVPVGRIINAGVPE